MPTWGALGFELHIKNNSTQDVVLPRELLYGGYFRGARLSVLIHRPGEKEPQVTSAWSLRDSNSGAVRGLGLLEPGKELRERFVLAGRPGLDGGRTWEPWFETAGEYTIKLAYSVDDKVKATSNAVRVAVSTATNDAPLNALEYVQGMKEPQWLFDGEDLYLSRRPISPIEKLATEFPPNVYSDYAHLCLAKYRLQEATRDRHQREPLHVREVVALAEQHLSQINVIGFPMVGEIRAAQREVKAIEKVLLKRAQAERR